MLTNRYLYGVPEDSRAASQSTFLKSEDITENLILKVAMLNKIAEQRKQSMAQLALAWVLRNKQMTSVLIGASKVSQIDDCVGALQRLDFTVEELDAIDRILESH
ncbi:NADP-dependent oxidoreductase domain containing protein [Pelosinus fermentans JBW45]|uniref:NADP-dependent oxidoreductase domain containing protein n=1 Tax=Pelosinus fermentans JBW45 TaxID=1192197 RepID=I9DLX2_9FIRM|nr:NADP-dependent oxidoreductase domain containing protein [Pelosinus fermentans JBW45]